MLDNFKNIRSIQDPKKLIKEKKKITWKDILYTYNKIPIISAIIFIFWAIIWLSFSNSPLTYNELFFIFIDGIISFVLIATNLILLSTIITFVFLRVLSNSKIKLKEALFLTSLVHSAYSFIPLIIVLFLPIFAFIVLFILVFFTLAGIIFLVIIFLVLIAAYIITNYFTLSKMYPKDKSLLIILLTIHFFLVLIILSILVGFFSLVSILAVFSGFM